MYIVKVGEYYVRGIDMIGGYIGEITLSKEIMRNFKKNTAELIAKKVNGEVIEMANQVTMNDEKYKQLSIFDDEVANAET